MRPLQRMLACRILAWGALILTSTVRAADEPPTPLPPIPEEPASVVQDAGIPIFLETPDDLDAFWRRLKDPDFILLSGGELKKLIDEASSAAPRAGPRAFVIESVAARGAVAGDLAGLSLDFGITVEGAGPVWVPIRLDGLKSIRRASEAEHELPLRVGGGGAWEIELRGQGHHAFRVEMNIPVLTTVEGHRLDFAIPEAAKTSVELEIGSRVVDALAGDDQRVTVTPMEDGKRSRLSAHLSPRSRVELSWRIVANPDVQLAPLLSMQGNIAIDVDPGSFRTRSSWSISPIRGTTRTLELRLHPDDDVLYVEVDGQQMPPSGIEHAEGMTRLTIPLTEPLRIDPPTRLVMTTSRPLTSPRITFGGFPLTHAKDQSGAVGITPSANLWIDESTGRALRRIDPRTELPDELRSRPNTVLAYQFFDQPFELNLGIEPSPPSVDSESRTTLQIEAGRARLDTWVIYRSARGRLFEVNLRLPRGLELESVGPEDVVESSRIDIEEADGSRVLTVRLTEKAREGGDFRLHLVGRQAIDPALPVQVALFQPRGTNPGGGRIAILTGHDVTVDRQDPPGGAGSDLFRTDTNEAPSDWLWPPDRTAADSLALSLQYDGHPAHVPLQVTVHPISVTHATRLNVAVAPRGTEIRQESDVNVRFGTLGAIDLAVPKALDGRWELENGEGTRRIDRGTTAKGERLVRLTPAREVVDTIRLKFRIRLPTRPGDDRATALDIPWIRVIRGEGEPMRVRVAADPGVLLLPRGQGWSDIPREEVDAAGEGGPLYQFVQVRDESDPAPLRIDAARRAVAELPTLVASRLWLRTWQRPEGDLQTRARYRVVKHAAELSLALPDGAEWVEAKVMGEVVDGVETLSKPGCYRIAFSPRAGSAPVDVELEYTVPARFAGAEWSPPRLLDGGLVQQTIWEVRVPWSRTLVGTPPGWFDENRWQWEGYVWRRRPARSPSALDSWIEGRSPRPRREVPDEDIHGTDHGYVFGRAGEPVALRLLLVSRAVLVAVCSGMVLGFGILVLRRYPARELTAACLLAMAVAVAAALEANTTLLAVQSAVLGVILTVLAALMQRVQNRRAAPATFGEVAGLGSALTPGSSLGRWSEPGSDDSTAIRVRPASTVDHIVIARPEPSDGGLPEPSP